VTHYLAKPKIFLLFSCTLTLEESLISCNQKNKRFNGSWNDWKKVDAEIFL
jgi:hypothetical protein